MYSFLFRKTVFDGWDHILGLFLANIGYLVLLALGVLWWHLNANGTLGLLPALLLIVATILVFSFYSMGIAGYTANINDGARKGQALSGVTDVVRTHVPHVLMYAFIMVVIAVNFIFAIPFYMESGGFAGPMMAFVGMFLSFFLIANFKYYLPLCLIRQDEGVVEIVKYSFAYALDNKGITLMLLLRSAVDLLISVPFAGIIPSIGGILLSDTCATSLLNRRYLLAEEREVEKSSVPWDDVLDTMNRDRYEKRRFVSLLFPGR